MFPKLWELFPLSHLYRPNVLWKILLKKLVYRIDYIHYYFGPADLSILYPPFLPSDLMFLELKTACSCLQPPYCLFHAFEQTLLFWELSPSLLSLSFLPCSSFLLSLNSGFFLKI